MVRDSTGVVTAKLVAEKSQPAGRRGVGPGGDQSAGARKRRMLQPYAPAGLAAIGTQYKDTKNPPNWWGMDVWGATGLLQHRRGGEDEPAEARAERLLGKTERSSARPSPVCRGAMTEQTPIAGNSPMRLHDGIAAAVTTHVRQP